MSRRKQKNTLDGLNNNIEVGYSNIANISKLTDLEENKFRQLKQDISESSEKIKELGKHLINTWLTRSLKAFVTVVWWMSQLPQSLSYILRTE